MPTVGIVISNYNGWQDTVQCLQSLQKQTFTDFEIILLDDASPNDSVAQLGAHLPANTVFLPQSQNLGFAAANNVGIRRALADGCDWVLLLNNDTVAAPDFLQNLLANTPAGAVSCPKMLFMDPPDEIWFAGGALDRATGKVKHLGGHQKDGPAFSQPKQVSFITFCCVLLPRAVIERVGFLDETLFMYCEDVDYCLRLGDAGVPLWFFAAGQDLAQSRRQRGGHAFGLLHHAQHAVPDLQGQKQSLCARQNRRPAGGGRGALRADQTAGPQKRAQLRGLARRTGFLARQNGPHGINGKGRGRRWKRC